MCNNCGKQQYCVENVLCLRFGYVEFSSGSMASNAMSVGGMDMKGREVRVDVAQPRGDDSGGRRPRGGRGGPPRGGEWRGRWCVACAHEWVCA